MQRANMGPVYHQNIIHPGLSGAETNALVRANTIAISRSNAASSANEAGRYDEAIRLHQEALDLKLQAYPDTSVQAGISYNGLGEALLGAGRLQEADEALAKALTTRERDGPPVDAAATRDNIGALREAQGRFAEAKEVRLRGKGKNEIMCGNYKCPTNAMYALSDLQGCGACKSVFYCSKACQKQDWIRRHKPLCKAHCANAQASNQQTTTG